MFEVFLSFKRIQGRIYGPTSKLTDSKDVGLFVSLELPGKAQL